MPTNQFIVDNIAALAVVALLLVVTLLVVIATLLWRVSQTHMRALFTIDLSDQITQLGRAAEHHADVSAVVTMMRQLSEMDDDAVALLKSYPESVRAAAWLHYINCLGSDLQAAQQTLSDAHQVTGRYAHRYVTAMDRQACQERVDEIRAKLDKAVKASGQYGLRSL